MRSLAVTLPDDMVAEIAARVATDAYASASCLVRMGSRHSSSSASRWMSDRSRRSGRASTRRKRIRRSAYRRTRSWIASAGARWAQTDDLHRRHLPRSERYLVTIYRQISNFSGAIRADDAVSALRDACVSLDRFPASGVPRADVECGMQMISHRQWPLSSTASPVTSGRSRPSSRAGSIQGRRWAVAAGASEDVERDSADARGH